MIKSRLARIAAVFLFGLAAIVGTVVAFAAPAGATGASLFGLVAIGGAVVAFAKPANA